jgi:hypothetical protein
MPEDISGRPCHCLLCDPVEALTERQALVTAHVRTHGWHVTGVRAEQAAPGWAYSVGLWHSYRSPEVSVFGLPTQICLDIVNNVGDLVRDGAELRVNQRLGEVVDDYDLALRKVRGTWFEDLFGQALGFYRTPPLPILQLVWPDRAGLFPWDEGTDQACRERQPQLWLPYDVHPLGVWTSLRDELAWPFGEACPDLAVLTTKRITAGAATIIGVVHDADGEWQFLDGGSTTVDDGTIVHLRHIVDRHPYVCDVADLRRGEQAWRGDDGIWTRSEHTYRAD